MQSRSGTSPLSIAVLLFACFVMAAALTVIGQPPAPASTNDVAVSTPSRTPFVVPTYDRRLTPEEHAQVMLGILLASIPPRFTLPDSPVVTRTVDGRVEQVEVQGTDIEAVEGGTQYTASTEVYLDGPYGVGTGTITLSVLVGAGAMPVVEDPCSIPGPPQPDTDIECRVVTTESGARVRVASTYGWRFISAAIAYPGVTVFAIHEPSGTVRPSTEPALANRALAELVATPALKPS